MKITLALLLALLSAGCVNFGEKPNTPAMVYYVLDDAGLAASAPASLPVSVAPPVLTDAGLAGAPGGRVRAPLTLLVLDTTAGGFYDTDQLVFSRSPATRGQYQFARWTERPGKRFAELMRTRIDRLGRYRVAAAGGYVRGDLLLDTELVEFYHDAASEPGVVRLRLRAELIDLGQRTLLARRVFETEAALARYDAAGAAEASAVAVGRTLDALTAWLTSVR